MSDFPHSTGRIVVKILLGFGLLRALSNRIFGQRITAVIGLTWKAAFRFRLFWVLALLLIGSVVVLPLIIKDDGTARGFTQILLTYTIATITGLLGLATLWLSCGTMSRDIEEAQIQMLAVKPIARWQIWIGKWLGLVFLNATLLAIAGSSVFALMLHRAKSLPPPEQAILQNEIFVARGSAKQTIPDLQPMVEQELKRRLQEERMTQLDVGLLRKQLEEQARSSEQVVPPNYAKRWVIDLGFRKNMLRDQPLFLRLKFHSPQYNSVMEAPTYRAVFYVGVPETTKYQQIVEPSLASDTFHEFQLQPNLFDDNGKVTIHFQNENNTALLFPMEDGIEILYREGGFGLNFIRGLGIILCWLALLAAVGLCAASLLSFPVAAFFAIAVLILGMSSGTLSTVVEQGSILGSGHEGERGGPGAIDRILVPVFHGALKVINLVQGFSPIDSLSTGRSITWTQLGLAFTQIVLLLGGIFALIGTVILNRRELAAAQTNT